LRILIFHSCIKVQVILIFKKQKGKRKSAVAARAITAKSNGINGLRVSDRGFMPEFFALIMGWPVQAAYLVLFSVWFISRYTDIRFC